MRSSLLRLALVVPALGPAACTSDRAPAPALLRVEHALLEPLPVAPERVLVIDVDGRSVTRLPPGLGRPLASSADLITGSSNEPLAASASPAERVLLVRPDAELPPEGASSAFGSVGMLPGQRVLVPAACVASLRIAPPDAPGMSPSPRTLVELLIRATDRPSLTLRAERDASEEESALGTAHAAGPPRRPIQSLRVEWPLEHAEGEFLLAIPAAPDRGVLGATLWRLRVREAGPGEPAVDEARALVESIRASAAPPRAAGPWREMARSLRQTGGPGPARGALAFASVETGADLTAEAASLADDRTLPALAKGAAEALEGAAPDTARGPVAWSLDRATILTLAKMHAQSALPRVMASVLAARFGEVGRDPPALAELARRCGSAPELARRLEAEHLILLDDASPALRVRAYDWLAARGAAPTGYDPLGPARERRAAVDRHLQAAEAKP